MMDAATIAKIVQGFTKLAKRYGPAPTVMGTVTSVSESTCTIDDDGVVYEDVRLSIVLDGSEGQTITPKQGAYALAVRIEQSGDWMMVACSEVDKWRLSVASAEIEQDETGLLIKKGTDTLKDALLDLIAGIEVVVVLQGTNPNYVKIAEAKTKILNLLR